MGLAGQGEVAIEGADFLAQGIVSIRGGLSFLLGKDGEAAVDEESHLADILLLHAASGDRGSTDPDAGGGRGAALVKGDSVFVDGDADFVESNLSLGAVETLHAEIHEEAMVIRAAGDDTVAELREFGSHGLGVTDNLGGIGAEFRLESLAEAGSLGGDDVHERPALHTGESGAVEFLGPFFLAHDQPAARTAEALVRGGGHEVGIRNR